MRLKSIFIAGAIFGDVVVLLLVAGAAFGQVLGESWNAKCVAEMAKERFA